MATQTTRLPETNQSILRLPWKGTVNTNEISNEFVRRRDGIATKLRCAAATTHMRPLSRAHIGGPEVRDLPGVGIAAGSRSAAKSAPGATAPVAVPSISMTRWAALFDALISPVRSGAPR